MKAVKWGMVMAWVLGMLVAGEVKAGSLSPTNAPGPTMHTLEEIYNLVAAVQQNVATVTQNMAAVQQNLAAVQQNVALNQQFLDSLGAGQPYLVIDLSGGSTASNYPVSYLSAVPTNGWTDEYKTTKLVLRRIPAGTFTMGSPTNELGRISNEDQHQVTLSQGFCIGVFEVTQKQWERVMGNWPSWYTNASYRDSRPVEQVSYDVIRGSSAGAGWPSNNNVDATSFMGKLRTKTGLVFDLPTESQWEYAGRAGTTTALNTGYNLTDVNNDAYIAAVGRYYYNGGSNSAQNGDITVGSAKVGSYLVNAWGLYDIHGNVWEWCLDWYGIYLGTVSEPKGATTGSSRAFRGGSWFNYARTCRVAVRSYDYSPDSAYYIIGFRVALPPGQ